MSKATLALFCISTLAFGVSLAGVQQDQSGQARPPSPPRRGEIMTISEGTPIEVRTTQKLSSETNKDGDEFEALLNSDLLDNAGRLVAPKGSRLIGRIVESKASGRVKGRARMSLELVDLYIQDEPHPLVTSRVEFEAEGTGKKDAKKVGVASGIGAIIGAIAGGKKGAAIGAIIGGGASTTAVLVTKGDQVALPKEQLLSFRLERDFRVNIR